MRFRSWSTVGSLLRYRALSFLLLAFCCLFFYPRIVYGLDYNIRVDSRFQMQFGDNAEDKNFLQTHILRVNFSPEVSFHWTGVLRKDLDGMQSKVLPGNFDASDVAFRNYFDSMDAKQPWLYSLYEAYLSYENSKLTLSLGRQINLNLAMFDGVYLKFTPWDWVMLSTFAGVPWHADFQYNLLKEHTFGLNTRFQTDDKALFADVQYVFLRENLPVIKATAGTAIVDSEIVESHYLKVISGYELADWMQLGLDFSALPYPVFQPFMLNAYIQGDIEGWLLDYKAGYTNQLTDISQLTGTLTSYSLLLNSSRAYQNVNLYLYKSIYNLFKKGSLVEDIQLEVGAEKRFLTDPSRVSKYNPEYFMIQAGFLTAFKEKWILHLYYDFFNSAQSDNTSNGFGADLTKKWKSFYISMGTAFIKYSYSSSFSGTVVSDNFDVREAYIKMDWLFHKNLSAKIQGTYDWAAMSSLSNFLVDSSSTEPLISRSREYYKVDMTITVVF